MPTPDLHETGAQEAISRLPAILGRVGSMLELIEYDLRYQTDTGREIIEAIYTLAQMQAIAHMGGNPVLNNVNAEVHTWLERKYRKEHPEANQP